MKVLILTDGREFQVVTCLYTPEDVKLLLASEPCAAVAELNVVGELPPTDCRFSMLMKPTGSEVRFARGLVEQDGEWQIVAEGGPEELITSHSELREIVDG